MHRNVSVRFFLAIFISTILIQFCASWIDEEEQQKPQFLTANVGEHVVFNCDLDFPHDVPIPYILKWNKDGKSVFSWYEQVLTVHEDPFIGRINLVDQEGFGKGSVNLTSIRESDHGWYQCKVLFPNRNPSSRNNGTWFYLTVQGGNLLEIPPINETALEGEPAQFHCVAKDPSSTWITWYKDGKKVRSLLDLSSRSFEGEDGTLTIRTTSMSDLGEYECEAINVYKDRQTARAYLNVQFKAKVVYAPKEVYFSYGEPAILDCHFRSNPPLKHLRWEKDGYLFDPYNVQGVFYKRNGSLFFKQVDETHAGIYTCTPFNELGTDGPSTGIRVIVQRSPVFVVTPNNLYLRKMGEDIEMPCDASDGDGTHKPAISWLKIDGILPEGRHNIKSGNLTIVRLQDSDRGIYQCSASNQAATITTETELIVENTAPRAPMNITAFASHTAVTLKWIPGQARGNGHKIDYHMWYKPVEQTEWRTIRIGQGISEVTIGDLNPGRLYEFMILTQDHLGDGMFSKSVTVRTKGASYHQTPEEMKSVLPIGCPRNVSVTLAVEGYMVSWEEPDFGLEHIKQYNVKWFRGHMEDMAGSINTTNLFHIIRYLEEDNSYIFIVYSVSEDYSSPSEKVILMVPAYKKIKAISITIMVTVALLGFGFGLFYYLRKKCFKNFENEKKSEKKCNSS